MQSGVPYSYTTDDAAVRLLGIGQIAASSRARTTRHSSYIQPEESARLKQLQPTSLDILLSHDSAKDSVTLGAGMPEIRTILDRHTPNYHLYGHTGEPYTQRRDSNGVTQTYKLADLVWEDQGGLSAGVMGILTWHDHTAHEFEIVAAPWLREYTQYTWRFIP